MGVLSVLSVGDSASKNFSPTCPHENQLSTHVSFRSQPGDSEAGAHLHGVEVRVDIKQHVHLIQVALALDPRDCMHPANICEPSLKGLSGVESSQIVTQAASPLSNFLPSGSLSTISKISSSTIADCAVLMDMAFKFYLAASLVALASTLRLWEALWLRLSASHPVASALLGPHRKAHTIRKGGSLALSAQCGR